MPNYGGEDNFEVQGLNRQFFVVFLNEFVNCGVICVWALGVILTHIFGQKCVAVNTFLDSYVSS